MVYFARMSSVLRWSRLSSRSSRRVSTPPPECHSIDNFSYPGNISGFSSNGDTDSHIELARQYLVHECSAEQRYEWNEPTHLALFKPTIPGRCGPL